MERGDGIHFCYNPGPGTWNIDQENQNRYFDWNGVGGIDTNDRLVANHKEIDD